MSVSMTMNGAVLPVMAMFIVAAEEQVCCTLVVLLIVSKKRAQPCQQLVYTYMLLC